VTVRDLLNRLQNADPDAVVLYLAPYADMTEAAEICDVISSRDVWTCERHRSADGGFSDVHHPAAEGLTLGWNQTTDEQWSERVVILAPASWGTYD
jgi:hypothetical protein